MIKLANSQKIFILYRKEKDYFVEDIKIIHNVALSLRIMKITPLTVTELANYRINIITRFASDKTQNEHLDKDVAYVAAEAAWESAYNNNSGTHVMGWLVVGETIVGTMWYMVRIEFGKPCIWLYDLIIDHKYRKQGFGREAMILLEEEAKRREIYTIGLHVFGQNKVAYTLYENLGFQPTSIVMYKNLVR